MIDAAAHAAEHGLALAEGGGELAPLALLHGPGEDLDHQIRDLLGQILGSEQRRCGLLAEIGGVEHQPPDVADGDAHGCPKSRGSKENGSSLIR